MAEDKIPSLQAKSGQRNSKNSGERKKRHDRDSSTDSSNRSGTRRGRSRSRKSTNEKTQDDRQQSKSKQSKPPGILHFKTSKFRPKRGNSPDESDDDLEVYADHHPASKHKRGGRDGGKNRDNRDAAKSGSRAKKS